nr:MULTISPECIES: AAA family ATPase [unclassified Bradyrhizobium]
MSISTKRKYRVPVEDRIGPPRVALTSVERRFGEYLHDRGLDCSPEELAGRKHQRAEDAKFREDMRRVHRWMDLSPASKEKLAARQAERDDAEHEAWLAAGAPNSLDDLIEKRAASRVVAESEWDEIRKQLVNLTDDDEDMTDEQVSAHEARVAAWHKKHDHLYPKKVTPVSNVVRLPVPPMVAPAAPMPDLIISSADFVKGFVPPEYLIDGMIQRRYFYSMTAQTGVGKTAIAMRWAAHVITGAKLGTAEVEKGTVLYLAGENPTDVQARWLGLSLSMDIDPATADIHFLVGAMNIGEVAGRIVAEVQKKQLSLAMVVVDTAAAYNFGDDENNNAQMGAYARQLRTLTNLPGGPCVIVLAHPTKRANSDDLMPRGGGAFIAEVDGNLAVIRENGVLTVCPQIKFRGSQDWKCKYELNVVRDHPILRDVKGRAIPTVVARPVSEGAAEVMEKRADADMELLLDAVHRMPSATPTDLARALNWTFGARAEPNSNRVKRNLTRLASDKLVKETLGKWRVTEAGQKELNAIELARTNRPLPPMPSGVHFPGVPLTS